MMLGCSLDDRLDTLAWGAGRADKTLYAFTVRNSGPGQAVNVSIHNIVLPMSEQTKRGMDEMAQEYKIQSGNEIGPRQPGWDEWTVAFESITSVATGQETTIPFRVENMGPLQDRDICSVLANTVRSIAPLHLPLVLRFSNKDGYT